MEEGTSNIKKDERFFNMQYTMRYREFIHSGEI